VSILDDLSDNEAKVEADISGLSVSESKTCSTCSATFSDSFEQRQHFKLDWHRFNLKRKIQNKPPVGEEEFEKLVEKSSSGNLVEKNSEKGS